MTRRDQVKVRRFVSHFFGRRPQFSLFRVVCSRLLLHQIIKDSTKTERRTDSRLEYPRSTNKHEKLRKLLSLLHSSPRKCLYKVNVRAVSIQQMLDGTDLKGLLIHERTPIPPRPQHSYGCCMLDFTAVVGGCRRDEGRGTARCLSACYTHACVAVTTVCHKSIRHTYHLFCPNTAPPARG